MTIDEFVQAEIDRTGKRLFTYTEVIEMTERWIALKQAAAASFPGWRDATVDQMVGVEGAPV